MHCLKFFGALAIFYAFGGLSACRAGERSNILLLHTRYGAFEAHAGPLTDIKLEAATSLRTQPLQRTVKVVQFNGPIQPAWRQVLVDHGLTLRGYIPDHALLIMATAQDTAWLSSLPMVRAVLDMPRLWRLHPQLVQSGPDGLRVAQGAQVHDLLVELAEEGVRGNISALVQQAGGQVLNDTAPGVAAGRTLHVHGSVAVVQALAAHPDVASVEPFVPLRVFNDMSYGLIQADSPHSAPLWQHGLQGRGQVVGLCDVGVFTNSCFFPSEKIIQYENITSPNQHDQSHGTHTAASVAGDQNDNDAYDPYDGMAPAAKLYIQDAGTLNTGEMSLPADLGVLFASAYAAGVRIHSDSWGGDTNAYSARERTLDAFVAAHRDFLVLLAAGNSGNALGSVESPATAKNIISVGALDSSNPETVVDFSAHGPTPDGRIKPTLIAPGMRVVSASSQTSCGTATMSGTSMATPILAGGAALVRQYYKEGFYPSGAANAVNAMQPSAALIKATLLAGADDMQGDQTDGAFPSTGQGFGRVHLANALYFAGDSTGQWIQDDNDGLEQGQTFTASVTLQGPSLHVALTWMDEAATPAAARALVNNLDLKVTTPDGKVLLGNHLVAGESVAGGSADETNVEEIVYVRYPVPGTYTITVSGANVPLGPQPFAVVASGAVGSAGTTSPATVRSASSSANAPPTRYGCAAERGSGAMLLVGAGMAWTIARQNRKG